MKKQKILYAVTIPLTAKAFLKGQLKWFKEKGHDVHLVTSPGEELMEVANREGCKTTALKMEREISLKNDLVSFIKVLWLLIKERPDVVNAGTPKASLLFLFASWLTRSPRRIYTLHGLRYQTTTGLKRKILIACEKLASGCATHVMAVSESVKQAYVTDVSISPSNMLVINKGSCNGFEAEAIDVEKLRNENRKKLQDKYGLSDDNYVIGFVGRFVKDKGIEELYRAFKKLYKTDSKVRLLLVGHFEDGDPLPEQLKHEMENDISVIITGFVSDVLPLYSIMNVYVLPTYREGLPYTALEAAACQLPVITTTATGARDSIEHGRTGIIVPCKEVDSLASAIQEFIQNEAKAVQYGVEGRKWVINNFKPELIWQELQLIYS